MLKLQFFFSLFLPFGALALDSDVNVLLRSVIQQNKEIIKNNQELSLRNGDLEKRNVYLETKLDTIESELRNIMKHVNKKSMPSTAFTASMKIYNAFAPGATILFENIITNEGNNYNAADGIYTCPEDGLYMFTVNSYAHSNQYLVEEILLDGTVSQF